MSSGCLLCTVSAYMWNIRNAEYVRGCDGGSGATGMMVMVRVADFGRSPLEPAAGEENFGPKGRFP